jgi:Cu(I)/Ag(I) efflux system membrane protein CusA/SilA
MTQLTTLIALLPLMLGGGAGAETMRRLAAPMVGGVASGYLAILLVLPVLFYLVRRIGFRPAVQPPERDEEEPAPQEAPA